MSCLEAVRVRHRDHVDEGVLVTVVRQLTNLASTSQPALAAASTKCSQLSRTINSFFSPMARATDSGDARRRLALDPGRPRPQRPRLRVDIERVEAAARSASTFLSLDAS
jgi:hypothetical protein